MFSGFENHSIVCCNPLLNPDLFLIVDDILENNDKKKLANLKQTTFLGITKN